MRLLRLIIECETPLHCGGGSDDAWDQPVVRDAFGYWRIPGSSLAGALRALGERINPALVSRMFGDQVGADSRASLVWCEDGLLLDFDGTPVVARLLAGQTPRIEAPQYIRDHVRIDPETGAAENGGKFDAEIVPAGARFLLEIRLDGWDKPETPEEIAFFDSLVALVLAGELSLGGKSGVGYGLYRALAHEYRDLDLFTREGMAAWLASPEFAPLAAKNSVQAGKIPAMAAAGLDGWLEIPLSCDGPILIGGGAGRPGAPVSDADIVFALTPRLVYEGDLHELWTPTLPGSSLRGVFRHAANAILRDLEIPDRESILNSLFGYVENAGGACGKLVFADAVLRTGGKPARYQFEPHVALDRFSGSALDGALFSDEPFWNEGATAGLRVRARGLEAAEAALFFHVILDFLEGSLAVGSGTNRGNGRLELKGWKRDPRKAAAAIRGDLTWNGEKIIDGSLTTLEKLAPEWDAALRQNS